MVHPFPVHLLGLRRNVKSGEEVIQMRKMIEVAVTLRQIKILIMIYLPLDPVFFGPKNSIGVFVDPFPRAFTPSKG